MRPNLKEERRQPDSAAHVRLWRRVHPGAGGVRRRQGRPVEHNQGRPGPAGNPAGQSAHRTGNSSSAASAAFGFGTVLLVLGALAVLWQNSNHSACGSALVQAVSQSACQEANER
jgi:hypothetical protein